MQGIIEWEYYCDDALLVLSVTFRQGRYKKLQCTILRQYWITCTVIVPLGLSWFEEATMHSQHNFRVSKRSYSRVILVNYFAFLFLEQGQSPNYFVKKKEKKKNWFTRIVLIWKRQACTLTLHWIPISINRTLVLENYFLSV